MQKVDEKIIEALVAGAENNEIFYKDILEKFHKEKFTPEEFNSIWTAITSHNISIIADNSIKNDTDIEALFLDKELEQEDEYIQSVEEEETPVFEYQEMDSVKQYYHEISRYNVLTREQEAELGKKIQDGFKAQKESLVLQEKIAQADEAEKAVLYSEAEKINEVIAIGKRAKDKLIEHNLRLVVDTAKHYPCQNMSILDLIQEGNLGLIRATERFDYTKGYKFSTYATWWIKQAVSRGYFDKEKCIRIPVHMLEMLNRMRREKEKLTKELMRDCTAEELAERMGVSVDTIDELMRVQSMETKSLDAPIGEDKECTLVDFVESENTLSTEEEGVLSSLAIDLREILKILTTKEQRILELRYGLNDGRERTLEEIGEYFDITRERVRQIERKALSKLRNRARRKCLDDYIYEN